MYEDGNEIKSFAKKIITLCDKYDAQSNDIKKLTKTVDELYEENKKLKYDYEDSLLKRDVPLPYKWKQTKHGFFEFCPKCDMMISNWQKFCHSCGQRIKSGNPDPAMEVKEETIKTNGNIAQDR